MQYYIAQNNPDSADNQARNHFFTFPMNTQSSEITFVGDFDGEFNRVLKVAGIQVQFYVPKIDNTTNVALFVGTSALSLTLADAV